MEDKSYPNLLLNKEKSQFKAGQPYLRKWTYILTAWSEYRMPSKCLLL